MSLESDVFVGQPMLAVCDDWRVIARSPWIPTLKASQSEAQKSVSSFVEIELCAAQDLCPAQPLSAEKILSLPNSLTRPVLLIIIP